MTGSLFSLVSVTTTKVEKRQIVMYYPKMVSFRENDKLLIGTILTLRRIDLIDVQGFFSSLNITTFPSLASV
jgi:hypothetical protein